MYLCQYMYTVLYTDKAITILHCFDRCHLTGLLATACGDDCIRIFREESDSDPNQPSFTLVTTVTKAHSNDVNSVSWNRAVAGLLASGSDDGTVKLWKFVEN